VYAVGLGETRSSKNLLRQVRMHSDPEFRLQLGSLHVRVPLPGEDHSGLRLEEICGREGRPCQGLLRQRESMRNREHPCGGNAWAASTARRQSGSTARFIC